MALLAPCLPFPAESPTCPFSYLRLVIGTREITDATSGKCTNYIRKRAAETCPREDDVQTWVQVSFSIEKDSRFGGHEEKGVI